MLKAIFFDLVTGLPNQVVNNENLLYKDELVTTDNKQIKLVDTIESDQTILNTWHLDNNIINYHTEKPSDYYFWDVTTFSWQPDKTKLSLIRLNEIKNLWEAKDVENLTYDNKILQVASIDRENITGKINEIQTKIDSNIVINESEMYWRDYNNVIHTWVTPAVYLQWLKLLVVAFAERRSALYLKSWEHKTAIETLVADINSSIEDILSYDITSGW
jgi:hypothetical protein